MDLFLYMFPKYLDKIYEQTHSRDIIKNDSSERIPKKPVPKGDKIKTINKDHNHDKDTSKTEVSKNDYKLKENKNDNLVKANGNNIISKRGEGIMANKVEDKDIDREKDIDKNKSMDKNKDIDVDKDKNKGIDKNKDKDIDKDKNIVKDIVVNKGKNKDIIVDADITKNEIYNNCIGGMEKILKELIEEKVDISIADSTMFLLNAVTVLSVEGTIVKLKTTVNTTIVIPIQEIVAIRSNLIYGISFKNNCNLEVCKEGESLRRYFASIIGKKVSIQTKGEGEFKYINSRIVTGTGKGIVIIEGTIAISLSKINLIEEIT